MEPLALWRILQVVLGIGLVIFVHELGHFLAARWCRVRVEVFSLGFGPRLFGWRRGETLYQIAAVPLGGYVRMAGDDELGRRSGDPRELGSKSVGQRFLIYSGGVIMNVVFGLVVFPILFTVGVPLDAPVVTPLPGGPAWRAGLEPGTRVLAVDGKEVHDFVGVLSAVAIAPRDELALRVLDPGSELPREVHLSAVRDPGQGIYTLGVAHGADPEHVLGVAAGSAADEAGLREGDRLLGVLDVPPGLPLLRQLERALDSREPLRLRVLREGHELEVLVPPRLRSGAVLVGITPSQRRVEALRSPSPGADLDLREGDVLLSVDGRPILRHRDLALALEAGAGPVTIELERQGRALTLATRDLTLEERRRLALDVALTHGEGRALFNVLPGSAAERAGLRDGDEIRQVDGSSVATAEAVLARAREAVRAGRALTLTVLRGAGEGSEGQFLDLRVEPGPVEAPDYGFHLAAATYVYQAGSLGEALSFGASACWRFLQDTWLTLKSMLFGRVSADNIGGPILIAVVSHSMAELGLAKFFFFLCILSINLALINVLPIPLLDGGHLLFLLIEKLKGSPVSERVMSYSQLVGLVLIATLFVFVIFNDIQRVLGRVLG